MGHVIFILITLALLAGFLVVTEYESRRGARVFASKRDALDAKVARAEFILEHVDFWAFVREEFLRIAHRLGHDIARLSLEAVRAIERLLTRLVKRLRMHRLMLEEDTAPRETTRPFVKSLSDFKDRLKKAAKENGSDEPTPEAE